MFAFFTQQQAVESKRKFRIFPQKHDTPSKDLWCLIFVLCFLHENKFASFVLSSSSLFYLSGGWDDERREAFASFSSHN